MSNNHSIPDVTHIQYTTIDTPTTDSTPRYAPAAAAATPCSINTEHTINHNNTSPTMYNNNVVQLDILSINSDGTIQLNTTYNPSYHPTPVFTAPPSTYTNHNNSHIIDINHDSSESTSIHQDNPTNPSADPNGLAQYFTVNNLSNITTDILFAVTMFILLSELIVSCVVYGVTYTQACDTHIGVYVIGFGVRTLLYAPLLIYKRQHPELQHDTATTDVYMCGSCISYRMIKTTVEMVCLVWFIIGNVFYFTSNTCSTTSPVLYHTALAWLIISYIGLALPILLLLSMSLCFPVVYIFLRVLMRFAPERFTDAITGVTQSDIDKLPIKLYQADMFDSLHSQCGICLLDYQVNDELRFLNCTPQSHHFHTACVDDWLKLQGTCPTCRSDIKTGTQRIEQRRITLPDSVVFGSILTRPADAPFPTNNHTSPIQSAINHTTMHSNSPHRPSSATRRSWADAAYTHEYIQPGSRSYLGANSQPRPYTPSYVGFAQGRRASPHFSGAFDDQLGAIPSFTTTMNNTTAATSNNHSAVYADVTTNAP